MSSTLRSQIEGAVNAMLFPPVETKRRSTARSRHVPKPRFS